jgi:hypothetical protein
MINDVKALVTRRWNEADAIRAVAAKYDVPDYELALLLLYEAAKEMCYV